MKFQISTRDEGGGNPYRMLKNISIEYFLNTATRGLFHSMH